MDKFVVKRFRADRSSPSSAVQLEDQLPNRFTVTADVHAADVELSTKDSPILHCLLHEDGTYCVPNCIHLT